LCGHSFQVRLAAETGRTEKGQRHVQTSNRTRRRRSNNSQGCGRLLCPSEQLKEAIPLYLRVLELQPEDANAREKLATGFILTNQRDKAIEMLEQIIKEHPDKYQPYDLLAQVLDDEARSLQRANRIEEAKATFAKVSA